MQSKQESVTKGVKEEESLTRFGWSGKMEREREREDERREEEEEEESRASRNPVSNSSPIFSSKHLQY